MNIDNSVLLHNNCTRLLRKNSNQLLVDEVMYKLFNCKTSDSENKKNKKNFIELLLSICCCHFEN
ncbi:hypothetical protein ceV_320 [Chrysochromulina ericina virus CeV-01B]|jgi:hypothetical protein|uniref:Uncharacterized protein n=1 Tax=Chrysochromulina ericina virus CeV-01B TaxID=3070830 RepID=A0A0N9R3X2_9VIRU|nr:hypothetical protein ceV_320 [Chrysochromulina ericina virus]ALH23226.1 hypothetical protein ceV_320 [Chrysochromulina ericina virus CeV-01B]